MTARVCSQATGRCVNNQRPASFDGKPNGFVGVFAHVQSKGWPHPGCRRPREREKWRACWTGLVEHISEIEVTTQIRFTSADLSVSNGLGCTSGRRSEGWTFFVCLFWECAASLGINSIHARLRGGVFEVACRSRSFGFDFLLKMFESHAGYPYSW